MAWIDRPLGDISAQLSQANLRLHILGVGTSEGAPIPMGNGNFVKDQNNSIILPRLEASSLKQLADLGKGNYFSLSSDDSDIKSITNAVAQDFPNTTELDDRAFDLWEDRGFWLIILLIPLLLASFLQRRCFCLGISPNAPRTLNG